MKQLILMLFVTLGVALTSQAQSVESVQDNVAISQSLQDADFPTISEAFGSLEYTKTNLVAFTYENEPSLNKIIVTTTDTLFAEVLELTYDLKTHEVNDVGKHTFIFGNKVREARIYTNLVSANGTNFKINRVIHTNS